MQTNVGNELPVDDRYISDGSQKNNGLTIWINWFHSFAYVTKYFSVMCKIADWTNKILLNCFNSEINSIKKSSRNNSRFLPLKMKTHDLNSQQYRNFLVLILVTFSTFFPSFISVKIKDFSFLRYKLSFIPRRKRKIYFSKVIIGFWQKHMS